MPDRKMLLLSGAILTVLTSSGLAGGLPPNTPATSANIGQISAVTTDLSGNVFLSSFTSDPNSTTNSVNYSVVTRLDAATGYLTLTAGTRISGFSGDNGSATSAQLSSFGALPMGVAVDPAGNLYIADTGNHRIRKVSSGVITTVAGSGTAGFSGDNGPATSAQLNHPVGVAVDSAGNLYISDYGNNRVRKVSGGIITTIAGGGAGSSIGDDGPATSAILSPFGIAVDSAGSLYVADNQHLRVRKVTSGTITTIAGNGSRGSAGDGGPATSAPLNLPQGVALDPAGNLYIAEAGGNRIRRVANGLITTIAGRQFDSNGIAIGPVGGVDLLNPNAVAVDPDGNVYFNGSPSGLSKLSKGAITAVAGGGPGVAFGADTVCTNTVPPVITSVSSASAYGGYSYFTSGSWLEIKGTNLIDPNDPRLTSGSAQWTANDFEAGSAPILLDGVSVGINGSPGYVYYLSPTQLNVQAPTVLNSQASVVVTNCKASSAPFNLVHQALSPGFLAPPNYSAGGTSYLVATFVSDGAYVLNSNTGASFGLNSRPAKPGDLIVAYGVGFGEVTPSISPGAIAQQSNALVNSVSISFGSSKASVSYAGLAGGFVGLYEFYITVPMGLADGDYPINATQNGVKVPQTIYLTVHT